METEYLNRVELRGIIGYEPKVFVVGESKVARFSVATTESFKSRNGEPREEITWHNVSAWSDRNVADFDLLHKGTFVYLKGRLRNQRYTDNTGTERNITEIVALSLEVVERKNQ